MYAPFVCPPLRKVLGSVVSEWAPISFGHSVCSALEGCAMDPGVCVVLQRSSYGPEPISAIVVLRPSSLFPKMRPEVDLVSPACSWIPGFSESLEELGSDRVLLVVVLGVSSGYLHHIGRKLLQTLRL